jgi:flagellar hook-length control protein FliK
MPSKLDYSGREIFSKNEVEIQGPSLKGDKTNEFSRIPVDEKSLNNEPDNKDAHVLSSGKNSSEINQSQVSQTKNSDQLQRPLQLDLLNQVVEKAVVNLKNGQTSINIDLKPEYLGRLRMHISTDNNQVVVKVMTDVPLVKEIMETNLSQLKTELQNHGLEIEKFDVFLNDGSNQDSAEHERWLFGKRESGAKEIIKPVSISDEITPLVAFSESGRVNGRIDCMA